MRRFYPDTNAVQLLGRTWTPREFDERAKRNETKLALGFHVIYELARGFRNPHHRAAVSAACRFLSEIRRIEFQPTEHAIIRAEFHRAVTGLELVTVLSPANQLLTRQELAIMAMGRTTAAALPFIERRETRARLHHPRLAAANMKSIRAGLAGNPLAQRLCKTFHGFTQYMSPTAAPLIRRLATSQRAPVTDAAARLIGADPERFPVISTWLNAQWYLMWIPTKDRRASASDTLDDFRHLIASAKCDLFVSGDRHLVKRAQDISPFRPTISWEELRARLL